MMGLAGHADAQTASGAANCVPTQTTPDPNKPVTTGRTGEQLSDKLARSDGVLCPPGNVDPDIRAPTPDTGAGKMPVIPPPGSPGGDPNVRPK